jgi:hypothetical protein
VDSIAKFKNELRKRKDISQVPTHYEIGPRKVNIILTQLRCFANMDKRLFFELLVELSHRDTWVHYYFVYHKTFVITSVFFFLPMIPSLTLYKYSLDPSLRNVDSIAKFKTELRKRKDISQVPTHYEIGP